MVDNIKPLLIKNAEVLNTLLHPMFIEYHSNAFIIAAKHPVTVKAKIQRLIREKKMNTGKIIQLDNSVVFEPSNGYSKK